MGQTLVWALVGAVGLAVAVLIAALVLLARRVRHLTLSIECLCSNLGGLREQIGHGGHEHA